MQSLLGVMLRAINLDNQFCLVTIKICNVIAYCLLPLKSNFVLLQKVKPQMVFLWGCIFTQVFSKEYVVFVIVK